MPSDFNPQSRRLVLIRANDAAIFPGWTADEPAGYDLAVSYYGDDPNAFRNARYRHASKGGKWEGLHALLTHYPEILDCYDWIWMPDDDIDTRVSTVNRLFDIVRDYRLEVAQPSLDWSSYFSHWTTLQNPALFLHYTNMIEIMAPVLSTNVLKKSLPTFASQRYGWAFDYLWPRLPKQPLFFKTAIIDAITVRHARPVGGGSLDHAIGKSPFVERAETLSRYFEKPAINFIYAVILRGGLQIRNPFLLRLLYRFGWYGMETGDWPDQKLQGTRSARRAAFGKAIAPHCCWKSESFRLEPVTLDAGDHAAAS